MSTNKDSTSKTEILHLGVAWLALSLAVTLLFADPFSSPSMLVDPLALGVVFGISFVTAGAGFLLHELAHKVVAQRYGYWAEFRADPEMLVIAIVSAAVGFLFAAPGAVQIYSYGKRSITDRENGVISVAGPATNLGLFAVFGLTTAVAGTMDIGIVERAGRFGMFVNAFLAAFNMIPFGPLDGRKVLSWSKGVFAGVIGLSVVLVVYSSGFLSL